MRCIIAIIVLAGLAILPVYAEDSAVQRGQAVVDQWCRDCHLRPNDRPDPDMAPPFEEIVERPGRDRTYLKRFIREDHFPMTMFRLFDHEKADVFAWLIALQKEQQD